MELFNSGHRDVAFRTPGNGEGLQLNVIERLLTVVNSTTKRRLGKLDPYMMKEYLRSKNVPPMSLLTALIFIEKFVNTESAPHLLEEMTAVELFTVSLILASKYLYDVDCDHGAYNSEFADAFGMDLEELNQLEIRFLSALDWCCFVSSKEVETIFRATEFGQPVSSNAERLKRYARITRFRRTVRTHCKRRKNVASKVLAVLAATCVTYMNGNFSGPAAFIANLRNSDSKDNSTHSSCSALSASLPQSYLSLALRKDTAINTSSMPAIQSGCFKYPPGLRIPLNLAGSLSQSSALQGIHHHRSAFVPNSHWPLIPTVACEG
ncbi:hypothetical protein FBUS_06527 [Fasciolopsis buskii]|uniref:Protein CNPPD1 n=1 Tax=Fasciolopsis buskii TaxID=27845 RepID=A0A8E0VHD3_9TREM|nr:hypothetical protein FBUS_06527 [Fasciolopsis buski]